MEGFWEGCDNVTEGDIEEKQMLVYAYKNNSLTFFHVPIFFKRTEHLLGQIR